MNNSELNGGITHKQYYEYNQQYKNYAHRFENNEHFTDNEVNEFINLCDIIIMNCNEIEYEEVSNIKLLLKFIYK